MSKKLKWMKIGLLAGLLGSTGVAFGLPTLQLTIQNGSYVAGTEETTYAGGNPFTLYALLSLPNNNCDPGSACFNAFFADTYYIAASVDPQTGPAAASLGSFDFDSTTVNVTVDMTYGNPPLQNVVLPPGSGDLQNHGIFPTYFSQFAFNFNSGQSTTPFDAQATTPTGPLPNNGGGMYFVSFPVDVANLNSNTSIHFDLYNSSVVTCGNTNGNGNNCVPGFITVDDFAPFSHDAQSGLGSSNGGPGGSTGGGIPEPNSSALALLGVALLAVTFLKRQKSHRA